MAKYEVTFKCGCVVEEQLYGKYESRYYYIEKAKERLCPECAKRRSNEESKEEAKKRGLASLTGTEKQVAWANTIREGAYKALDCILPYADIDEAKKMVEAWRTKMEAKNEAKWWIENRYSMPKAYYPEIAEYQIKAEVRRISREFFLLFNLEY